MHPRQPTLPERILTLLAGVLIVKVTMRVISNYHDYFPPNFETGFLRGREGHFSGIYRVAFYAHIVSGPVALVLGLILIGEQFRARFPGWHRNLGRVQVASVLLMVTPSGLLMAYHAAAGPIAAAGLASLSIATATCISLGTRSAMARRYTDHRRWMWRCYLLLCSAVVLRLIGGLATVSGVAPLWLDPVAIWMSWLVPLAAFEMRERTGRKPDLFGLERPRARAAQAMRDPSAH